MELLENGITPRQILTRETLLNGIAGTLTTGSSTNLVMHLISIAHEADVEFSLNDFDRISRQVPFIYNLQPSGKYPIALLDNAGGIPAVMKTIRESLDESSMTVSGKKVSEFIENVEVCSGEVLKTLENPQKPEGGIVVLYGNLAPNGAVVKQLGVNEKCISSLVKPVALTLWKKLIQP